MQPYEAGDGGADVVAGVHRQVLAFRALRFLELRLERVESCRDPGLGTAAASFVTGTTVDQIEASADELASLIRQREQDDADDLAQRKFGPDFFARAAEDKQRRQREFLDALTGRPKQPHDELGRFTSFGFDGGSRTPPPPPAPTHDQTLSELFRTRAADVGRRI